MSSVNIPSDTDSESASSCPNTNRSRYDSVTPNNNRDPHNENSQSHYRFRPNSDDQNTRIVFTNTKSNDISNNEDCSTTLNNIPVSNSHGPAGNIYETVNNNSSSDVGTEDSQDDDITSSEEEDNDQNTSFQHQLNASPEHISNTQAPEIPNITSVQNLNRNPAPVNISNLIDNEENPNFYGKDENQDGLYAHNINNTNLSAQKHLNNNENSPATIPKNASKDQNMKQTYMHDKAENSDKFDLSKDHQENIPNDSSHTNTKTKRKFSLLPEHRPRVGLFNSKLQLLNPSGKKELEKSQNENEKLNHNEDIPPDSYQLHDKAWYEEVKKQEREKALTKLGKEQTIHYSRLNPKLIWSRIFHCPPDLPPPVEYDEKTGKLLIKHWDGNLSYIDVVQNNNTVLEKDQKKETINVGVKSDINNDIEQENNNTNTQLFVRNDSTVSSNSPPEIYLPTRNQQPNSSIYYTSLNDDSSSNVPVLEDNNRLGNFQQSNQEQTLFENFAGEQSSKNNYGESNNDNDITQSGHVHFRNSDVPENIEFNENTFNTTDQISSQNPLSHGLNEIPSENIDSQLHSHLTFRYSGDFPPHPLLPVFHHTGTFKDNDKRRNSSLGTIYKNYMELENMQGFVGLAALALAEIPSPKTLLKRAKREYFDSDDDEMRYNNDLESIGLGSNEQLNASNLKGNQTGRRSYEPTAAAGVEFKREHTRTEIMRRRFKAIGFLLIEYIKLGVRYILTFKGFAVTIYFMLIVAFGGMLFLLLCNASPAMSREWGPDDKVHSPRQIWIEIDSQVINALFCVTGLGLFPVRCRDFYYYSLGKWRNDTYCWRKVLSYHSNWFLPGYTKTWKLLLVVIFNIMNSIFQVLLCVAMWKYNRFNRPSWVTGTLIGCSFSFVIIGGLVMFLEVKQIKTLYIISNGKEGASVANPKKKGRSDAA